MSEMANRNARAMRVALEDAEKRMLALENEIGTLRALVQTCIDQVGALQRSNGLALAKLRGTGATEP